MPETNFVHFSVVVHAENLRIRDKSVGACKLQYINLATPYGTSLFDILLMICKVGEQMKCAARISFCANRAKVQIMRAAVATMDKRDTCRFFTVSRYGLLTKFHSFFLHFSISLFSAAICDSCCANVCDKSNRSRGKLAPLSLPRNAQVSEMILATFTLALLICNLAAMSMLMPRLAKLLCN